jgi:hypothetical protein
VNWRQIGLGQYIKSYLGNGAYGMAHVFIDDMGGTEDAGWFPLPSDTANDNLDPT